MILQEWPGHPTHELSESEGTDFFLLQIHYFPIGILNKIFKIKKEIKESTLNPGVEVHICHSSSKEIEAGELTRI